MVRDSVKRSPTVSPISLYCTIVFLRLCVMLTYCPIPARCVSLAYACASAVQALRGRIDLDCGL